MYIRLYIKTFLNLIPFINKLILNFILENMFPKLLRMLEFGEVNSQKNSLALKSMNC